jgi:hypothetical protein
MFTISNTVVTTLQGFFENLAREGIAKVPNEDICLATEQILAVAECLAEVTALPVKCTVQILEGFTKCSVNSLTAKSVPAGTKNSRPIGFYSRNSTKSTINPNTTIPQI